MARMRIIKPAFFINEDLAKLPFQARLLFIGLWTLSDRRGFVEDRPRKIKAQLFPYDRINIQKLVDQLSNVFIERIVVEDVNYIRIINFCKHQVVNRKEIESTVPEQFWNSPGTVPDRGEQEQELKQEQEQELKLKQEEEEKEKEKEKGSPPPPTPFLEKFYVSDNGKISDYQETLSDFLKVDSWHDAICSEFKIELPFLIEDMKNFLLKLKNQDQFPRKLSDTKRYYYQALEKYLKAKASKAAPKKLDYAIGKKK